MNPVDQISKYLELLRSQNSLAPMCLSTVSLNGYPNSRFVDLKVVMDGRLFFGTDQRSTKAREFGLNPKVSICGWWERLQVQVRVMGTITKASEALSDQVFATRNTTAKALAIISRQSEEIHNLEHLKSAVLELTELAAGNIARPGSWSVFAILPEEVEILTFSEDRIHQRKHYERTDDSWRERWLSP